MKRKLPTSIPAEAAADVFAELASMLFLLREILREMDDDDAVAISSMHMIIGSAGAIADDAAMMLGGARMTNTRDWLSSPVCLEALESIAAAGGRE